MNDKLILAGGYTAMILFIVGSFAFFVLDVRHGLIDRASGALITSVASLGAQE